ncbi:hypothetical protein JN27_15610 [Massilia sp. BSC265]|nr:hypothetical protein JN27_15610 [Massilia sp. BSC265]
MTGYEPMLYWGEPENWALEDGDVLVLVVDRVRSVRVAPLPAPGAHSAEGENIAMGIGRGTIETGDGCYRFGAGLDEDRARVTAARIAA